MRMRAIVAGVGALGAIVAGAVTTGAPATAGAGADVRVGTFNIVTVSSDGSASGERKVWKERRATVVSQILAQRLDVVGLQEANQSTIYQSHLVDGKTQYIDLRNGLNAAGGHYALTSVYSYNCYRPWSSRSCHYRNRAAAGDNRILYNTDTTSLVYKGAYRYPHQVGGKTARYLAWAVLRVKATGHDFLFTSTHLDPYSKSVRVAQWRDMIAKINKIKGARPVVAVGDFNSTKYDDWARTMLPAMASNGYGDALGQRYHKNPTTLRSASTHNAWINSFNAFRRNVAAFGYEEDRYVTSYPRTGNGVDWIFASNSLPVRDFEVVADMDPNTLQLTGTIPSDHNMLRATVGLP